MKPQEKICSRCKQSKDLIDFDRDRKRKDGRFSYCKSCRFIENHLPHIRERQKKANLKFRSRADILEIYKKHNRKYSQSEKGKATIKAYVEKHKKELKVYHKEYSEQWAKTSIGKISLRKAQRKNYYKDLEHSRKLQRNFYYKRRQKI